MSSCDNRRLRLRTAKRRSPRRAPLNGACLCPILRPPLLPLLLAIRAIVTNAAAGAHTHLAAAANFSSCAPPVSRPDVNCCKLPDLMKMGMPLAPGAGPHPRGYLDWSEYLRRNPLPREGVRVRPAAHLAAANRTYLDLLHRAYRLMAELPPDDPRSRYQQVNLHCMSGSDDVTMQLGFPEQEYSTHFTWFFLPYHRMYIFFYERILGKLVGDDTFALPFWNWDNQLPLQPHLPNVIPPFYRDPEQYPALYHGARDPRHLPGNPDLLVDLTLSNVKSRIYTDDADQLRASNNAQLHRYIARPGARFLSRPLRAGDPLVIESDCFEIVVHGAVHYFLGDPDQDFLDMGHTYSAARDPIFCSHHANIDRLWAVWQSMGGQDYSDPQFLHAPFFFYDENAQLVRVTVADALDHRPMKYEWQEVENAWLTDPAQPLSQPTPAGAAQLLRV